jgi:RNA recognition motif-containing protein
LKKIFVGNLPYNLRGEDLRTIFSEAGTVVTADVVLDRETRRSRGFGFVEFDSDDSAKKAIELFNGKEIDGRKLVVNESKPRERQ